MGIQSMNSGTTFFPDNVIKRAFFTSLLLAFVLAVFTPLITYAAIPDTLSYKGSLTDSSNNSVSGTHDFTMRIYDASSGGTLLYSENHTGITVTRGSFDVLIGNGTNTGGSVTNIRDLAWDQQYFISLEITSLSTGEMSPRTPINSAAYSFITKAVADFGKPFYQFFSATTTTALTEGVNLYFTDTRFDNRLSATTSLPSITTLSGLTLSASQLSDFGKPFFQFFSATTTTALTEGVNLYFTDTRADARINATSSISTLSSASNLKTVGGLFSGSIVPGFGPILTGNTITGTTLNGTTGLNTGSGAGTQRIDSSGNLVNIGAASTTLLSVLNT